MQILQSGNKIDPKLLAEPLRRKFVEPRLVNLL